MKPESHYTSAPGTPLHSLRLLVAQLAETRSRHASAPSHSEVEVAFLDRLEEAVNSLEQVCADLAEMELGADGFDNSAQGRRYAAVQRQLLAAAREIVNGYEALLAR